MFKYCHIAQTFREAHSPDSLTVDVKIAPTKSAASRVGTDPNPQTLQSSPSSFTRISPIDQQPSSSALPQPLTGSRRAEIRAHHRQTSVVNSYHHSRSSSYASSLNSPISPHTNAGSSRDKKDALTTEYIFATSISSTIDGTSQSSVSSNSTILPERPSVAAEVGTGNLNHKRHNRAQNRKGSRDHPRHQSSARNHKEESKTVGEYALHVLFTSFIARAEEKISQCITVPLEPEPSIDQICGPGIDPIFDQLISALGHIASQKPKPLIDSMMLWRKNKSDAAIEASAHLQQSQQTLRRNTEPRPVPLEVNVTSSSQLTLSARQQYVAQAERRSTASIYILCRVLIEVISQSTLANITPEMEEKLEGIIFGQLKIAGADQLSNSPLRLANWFLFSQMLGVMGEISFKSVAERFIADLEKSQRELIVKGSTNRESEGRIELILGGMRNLRIQLYPEGVWVQSCNFMISLARLFAKAHGQRLKYAYCHALANILMPVAENADKADKELKNPKWSEVIGIIGPRLASMLVKPRHWLIAFPLTATLLCVSSIETFKAQWLQLILLSQSKFKDRLSRPIFLQAVSRLLWTYLNRVSSDSANTTIRKLDETLKLILPAGRKNYLPTTPSSVDPLVEIIRIIGFKFPEFCLRTIVFPLINADLFASGRELKIEQLEPEKIVIGIRAFLAIISDLENGEQGCPSFPQIYQILPVCDRYPISPILNTPRSGPNPSAYNRDTGDYFSRPVLTSALSEVAKSYYSKFCKILGKITIICDNAFGGQAVLDEKFNSPKTPLSESFNFARRDDHQNPSEQKQGFYELLHVAVQALPRFLSADVPFNVLVNLLCTGTAHVQCNIAESSAQSLKSIARQSHAQQVTIGFARFIFNFDDRYSTMSDGGMLGLVHIENTLRLYVELLQIWIEEIKLKSMEVAADIYEDINTDRRGTHPDLSGIWPHVDEVEAHGLFFLCSQSRKVRAFAITVLRLIKEFDLALGKNSRRLINIIEEDSVQVMDFKDEHLSVAERSRLQRGMQKGKFQNVLVELCSSETSYDTTLWLKLFPNLIRISYKRCPFAVTLGREIICNRILQMYKGITALVEVNRTPQYCSFDRFEINSARPSSKSSATPPGVLIEQWRLYLIVACITLSNKGGQKKSNSPSPRHLRKVSKTNYIQEKVLSARVLFKYIIPLLSVNQTPIRDSVVASLGSINANLYKTLLEELQGAVSQCNNDAKTRIHQRTLSNARRNRRTDLLRTEVTHVYQLTSQFLKISEVYEDDWILNNLVVYTRDLKMFLMDGDVQMNWEFHKLRRHYCGLMEGLFEGINCTNDPSRWITFESRKSSFALMEGWCGFSPYQSQIRQREDNMKQSIIHHQSLGENGTVTAAMEIEKRNLRTAALSAMAALCGGPLSFTTESRANLQFDIRRMLSWIDTILSAGSDGMHFIGRKALKNLITHNQDFPYLLEHSIARCYIVDQTNVLGSYFDVVSQVLLEDPDYPMPFWRLLGITLFTLGFELSEIRSKSAHLLRAVEERLQRSSKIEDYGIRISDKTKAVYKLAQFEISKRLSKQYPELAFFIFSEYTAYFKHLPQASQRNMVAVILPWIQIIELQIDPNGGPTAQSYVLLSNLCEITIQSSCILHNEVQALWQALATGPHAGNVQLILDFIMSLCLDRRENNFVEFAKQIVVFLSSTLAGVKVVEFLLMQITPKAMVPNDKRKLMPPPPDTAKFPYFAELSEILPVDSNPHGYSLGQLSLILLVDLMVSPVHLVAENVPLLLQVVTVLWDHYIPTVQEQAREMLIHIIHELVISKIGDELTMPTKKSIEEFVESIRGHDPTVVWSYEDHTGSLDDPGNKVPSGMERLSTEVVKNFEITYPGIQEEWSKLSLTWATSCPVRHLACRSFQIFRCILTSLDQSMLADMLARLSNTIADDDLDVQMFSMEILTTLRTLICKLDSSDLLIFPQIFWTICACLDTVNEREFRETLLMLEELMVKLDLSDSNVRSILADGRPPKWEGPFEGLQKMTYKGLRSSACLDLSLKTINNLSRLPNDDLIGNESRILFTVLANLPKFLLAIDQNSIDSDTAQIATDLAQTAEFQGCKLFAKALHGFNTLKHRYSCDFLAQIVSAIRETFLPQWDFEILTFLMGLLTNSLSWFKLKIMRILGAVIPEINMYKSEIVSHGPDLISPLLRLLQTELCMQALQVLDQIMTLTGTLMEKQHLRMSMTHSSSKAIRKEFARTPSLFGIPEETGWSIPVPAKHAEATRANVHTVFYSCQSAESMSREIQPTSEVEFHIDDFQYGYLQAPERAETIISDGGRGEGNINDLILKLDSLDGFFQDTLMI